jgi:phosphoribosylanthranilate isomerase
MSATKGATKGATKIKICGLFRDEDIDAVNRALPDYGGFVFAPSVRRVTPEVAARLRARLNGRVIPVGVFVEEAPERIAELYARGLFAAAQLHGTYRPEQIGELRRLCGAELAIIRAVAVDGGGGNGSAAACVASAGVTANESVTVGAGKAPDLLRIFDIEKEVDYPLFDYARPGSGRRFDWSLLARVTRPYFLAGGIGLGNIDEALALKPYCIDVSSGVETDGVKDPRKIKELVERVRSA